MSSTGDEAVKRLFARESATTSDADAAAGAARVLQRLSADLSRFIGSDGYQALLARARARAEATHPSLKQINITERAVEGVEESIQAHGAAQTAAGLEATAKALIDLLGRLIGNDLALKLVEQNSADGPGLDGLEGEQ